MNDDLFSILLARTTSTGGGGGGTGTDDYDNLLHRPQVNNHILTGNKSSADLGLASAAQGSKADSAIQAVKVNGATLTPDANKAVSVTVPTAGTSTPAMDSVGSAGSAATFSRSDHVHPSDTTKVDKVAGKGLSTNDFTNTLKTKLDGIASGAEVNVQSDWNQTDNTADDFIKHKPTLGTAAAADTTDFATAAQGTKADSAVQSAGSGLSKSGTTLNHSNSVTAKTTQTLRKISFDAQGHITGSSELSTAESNALASGIDSTKVAQIATNTNSEAEDRAALVELVDSGAKNFIEVNFTSKSATLANPAITNNGDGSITINGTRTASTSTILLYDISSDLTSSIDTRYTLPAGQYVANGTGNVNAKLQVYMHNGTDSVSLVSIGSGSAEFEYTAENKTLYPYICWRVYISGESTFDNFTFKPMVCTKADWDISQAYQPYRKDLAELTVDSDEDRATLVELVDSGAKNILDLTKATEVVKADELSYTLAADGTLTVTWTADLSSSGKTLQFKGFPYKAGTYILSGAQLDGSSTSVRADVREGSTAVVMDYGQPPTPFELPANGYNYVIRVQAPAGSATFKPMICSKAAWDISQAYVPNRPSYQELYEQVSDNENNILSIQQTIGDINTVLEGVL